MARVMQPAQAPQSSGLDDFLKALLPMLGKMQAQPAGGSTRDAWSGFMGGTSPDLGLMGAAGGADATSGFGGLGTGGQWPGLAPNLGRQDQGINNDMLLRLLLGLSR